MAREKVAVGRFDQRVKSRVASVQFNAGQSHARRRQLGRAEQFTAEHLAQTGGILLRIVQKQLGVPLEFLAGDEFVELDREAWLLLEALEAAAPLQADSHVREGLATFANGGFDVSPG